MWLLSFTQGCSNGDVGGVTDAGDKARRRLVGLRGRVITQGMSVRPLLFY